jgi:bacterial polymer biosynthesis proteins, WecB/TagA/CpsF family
MRKTIDILGIPVDCVDMGNAVEIFKGFLGEDRLHTIFTPNAEIMMEAQRDAELKDILCKADLLVADGAGVVLASKILKRPVPEKVSGIDLIREVFKKYGNDDISFFFFGSKPGTAEIAADNIRKEYPGIRIAGCRNGYFTKNDEEEIIRQINESKAEVLLIALGAPKQEKWIWENRGKLKVKACIGVGGTLDVFAGTVALAPEAFRKNGFEWLFRLYKEPKRAKRMLNLPIFVLRVIGERLCGR